MSPSHCHVTKRSQNVTIAMNPLSYCFYALTIKFDFTRLARLIRDYTDLTVFNCHKSYLPITWTLEISLRLAVVCLLCLINCIGASAWPQWHNVRTEAGLTARAISRDISSYHNPS